MAKREAASVDPAIEKKLSVLLERFAELERRVKQLEGERDAALALAAAPGPVVPVVEEPAISAPAAAEQPAPSIPEPAVTAPAVEAAAPPPEEEISEETLIAISAAVAAFLGKRAHIRQIRLMSSPAWAQQGRVSIMASHRWAVQR